MSEEYLNVREEAKRFERSEETQLDPEIVEDYLNFLQLRYSFSNVI